MKRSLFIIAVLLLSLLSCKKEQQKSTPSRQVAILVLDYTPYTSSLNIPGEITSESEHTHSFLAKGRLTELRVNEGDRVKKGAILARINADDYEQALRIARSQLNEANDQYDRLSRMYASGSLPEADFEKIKTAREQAEANFALYSNKLNYTTLRASIEGIVSEVWAKTGMAVTEGQPILTISNDQSVIAQIEIPEIKISDVHLQDSVKIDVRALENTYSGTIDRIYPNASRLSRSYKAQITLDNPDNQLKDGMLCSVSVFTNATDSALLVPLNLVLSDVNELQYVWVVDQGISRKRRIRTDELYRDKAIIEDGINAGDTIILEKGFDLRDGQEVTLK